MRVIKYFLLGILLLNFCWPAFAAPDYIGGDACESCHAQEYSAWQGSHHQLAMQEANAQSVLGDFTQASFSKDGVTSTFFMDGDRFMVNTDGPDGKRQDFEISYVFGVYPLQQYMIKFPQGKIQVLDIAWDSRPQSDGGQRWYSLHPDEKVPAGDVLHWTGPNLNWNYMCADCHSTNLQKNFDPGSESYQTTWTDIDVSCEACHGPGSAHRRWAEAQAAGEQDSAPHKGLTVMLNERAGVHWQLDSESGLPVRSEANSQRAEIEVCARCHSRRSQLSDDFVPGQPFMNAFHPSLLTEGLYYPDGQMQDEVYVWGSFQQSKMYAAGVTCSDCHDPHRADLKAPGEGVCYQCHAPDHYAQKSHHFHTEGTTGASCIECHMPASTLMGVDQRNEHAFRIPRPDLSMRLGTPNACNQCHDDKDAAWAAAQLKQWYGDLPRGFQTFADALSAARRGALDAPPMLQKIALDAAYPAIARATALSFLGGGMGQAGLMLLQQGLNDADPLVRQGALDAMQTIPMTQRILALPLLWDDIRSLRLQAARLLAGLPAGQLNQGRQAKLDAALEEYIQSQIFNAERPEAQLNIAGVYQDRGQFVDAEVAYRKALQIQPQFVPAYVNFANMLSNLKRETEAANLLAAGLSVVPDSADLHHALGLSEIRQKKPDEAVRNLADAARLAPENRRYQYVYALALQSTGDLDRAIEVLQAALKKFPEDVDLLYALTTFNRDAGQRKEALEYALKLQALLPANPDIAALVESLQP